MRVYNIIKGERIDCELDVRRWYIRGDISIKDGIVGCKNIEYMSSAQLITIMCIDRGLLRHKR